VADPVFLRVSARYPVELNTQPVPAVKTYLPAASEMLVSHPEEVLKVTLLEMLLCGSES
jgi:hypothetical protein